MKKVSSTIIFLSIIMLSYSQGYWQEVQTQQPYGALNHCVFNDTGSGWAVGQNGIIQHTADEGLGWSLQYHNTDKSFHSVYFINDTEGWVVGWNDILHTTDAGQNWESQSHPSTLGDFNDVFFLDQDNGWIVGWYKIILKTTDGGQTWQKISNSIGGETVYNSVKFFDEDHGILCGVKQNYGGIIMTTSDGGLNWTETGPASTSAFLSLAINDQDEVFVCGKGGQLFKSTDFGQTWTDKSFDQNYFIDIEFGENQTGYLMDRFTLYKTTDNGISWSAYKAVPYSGGLRDISLSGSQLYACGDKSSIYNIPEESNEWQRLLYVDPLNFKQIEFLNESKGFALGGYSMATKPLISNDGGYTWEDNLLIPEQRYYELRLAGQTLFLISFQNELLKSIDEGENWETLNLPPAEGAYFNDFSVPSQNTAYLCDDSSTLYKTTDGGHNWDKIEFDDYHKFSISYFYDDTFGWLVDDYSGFLLRTTDGGNNWTSMKVDPNHTYVPSKIYFINENIGFIITEIGYVYRSSDGGNNWEKVFELGLSYNAIFHFIDDNRGYLIDHNQIYYSNDGGYNWTEHQTLSQSAFCASFVNTNSWIGGMYNLMAINSDLLDVSDISTNDPSISVYPNPAENIIYLKNELNIPINKMEVISQDGKLVSSLSIPTGKAIDVSALNPGVYLIRIFSGQGISTTKLIVK
ncbi:MAG: T9SS type A sorting domain-containing protein [Chlorobi bacterium]|nr:T9SS type A sorting domain-containing protein [Chlorobiota bacterium]